MLYFKIPRPVYCLTNKLALITLAYCFSKVIIWFLLSLSLALSPKAWHSHHHASQLGWGVSVDVQCLFSSKHSIIYFSQVQRLPHSSLKRLLEILFLQWFVLFPLLFYSTSSEFPGSWTSTNIFWCPLWLIQLCMPEEPL